jgi:hypothetical protein
MTTQNVRRFPSYDSCVAQALAWDRVMADLCQDYDAVLSDLEALEQDQGHDRSPRRLYRELVRLKTELENEALERLASYSGTERSELPG